MSARYPEPHPSTELTPAAIEARRLHGSPLAGTGIVDKQDRWAVWTHPDGSVIDFAGLALVRDVDSGEIIAKINAFTAHEDPIPVRIEQTRLISAAPDLLAALESTATMLAYEAKCHEESGDAKRRTYVDSIRAQLELARSAIRLARGE